jgi:hypothetical protein
MSLASTTIPCPLPLGETLRVFPRPWFTGVLTNSAAFLAAKRAGSDIALALFEMLSRCGPEAECGIEDDPCSLAMAMGQTPDWVEANQDTLRKYLGRGAENGRLYPLMFVADLAAAWAERVKRRIKTEKGRKARQEARERAREEVQRAKEEARLAKAAGASPQAAAKPLLPPPPPPHEPLTPVATGRDSHASATNPSVGLVASRPVPSPAQGAGPVRDGGVGEGASADAPKPDPVVAARHEVETLTRRERVAADLLARRTNNPFEQNAHNDAWNALQEARRRLRETQEEAAWAGEGG